MESRKVQLTGGSTYTISLPKTWARRNDIEAGQSLVFFEDGDNLLLTATESFDPSSGELDISDITGEYLIRLVMAMYVSGFDIIDLTANEITTEQRQSIRRATQNLIGVEVLEETTDRIVIQDLLDSSELSVRNAVERMHLISESMLDDAIIALGTNDDDLARDVIDRDDDVDRLWFVVSRIFRSSLRSPATTTDLGMSREDCFDYHSTARQLERIADHAAKISQLSLKLDEIPQSVVSGLENLKEASTEVIDGAMDALFETDPDRSSQLANEARVQVLEIDEDAREIDKLLRELDPYEAQLLELIVDSLSRSGDYGGNIAETALQQSAPRP